MCFFTNKLFCNFTHYIIELIHTSRVFDFETNIMDLYGRNNLRDTKGLHPCIIFIYL